MAADAARERLVNLVFPLGPLGVGRVICVPGRALLRKWRMDLEGNPLIAMHAGPSGVQHKCSRYVPNKDFVNGGHAQCTLSLAVLNGATPAEAAAAAVAGFGNAQPSRRILLHLVLAFDDLCQANLPLPSNDLKASHLMQPTTLIVGGLVWESTQVVFESVELNESRKVCAQHRVAGSPLANMCVCLAGQTFPASPGVPGVTQAYAAHQGVQCLHW